MNQPVAKEIESEVAVKTFNFEQVFSIPDDIYENIEVADGEYALRNENNEIVGSVTVSPLFDTSFFMKGKIHYYTPDRLLFENGDLKAVPRYVGHSLVNVAPIDPAQKVLNYLIKVELAYFQLAPKR